MILADRMIKAAIAEGLIVIDPYRPECLGTNSYDVHLGRRLLVSRYDVLDPKNPLHAEWDERLITPYGCELSPGRLYLGVTEEYTESHACVPFLDGKSSVGRLGIFVHATAGRGDVGFRGHWTLEISVVQPVIVYAGMPIGQLIYFETTPCDVPYDQKPSAKYNHGRSADPRPMPSQMWRNFEKQKEEK